MHIMTDDSLFDNSITSGSSLIGVLFFVIEISLKIGTLFCDSVEPVELHEEEIDGEVSPECPLDVEGIYDESGSFPDPDWCIVEKL